MATSQRKKNKTTIKIREREREGSQEKDLGGGE
jgi:hypothetical protein